MIYGSSSRVKQQFEATMQDCPFNKPVLKNIFDVDLFSCINYPLTANYAIRKMTAK